MNTEKAFEFDGSITECEAVVLECNALEGGEYEVVLDKTAIFPEGGGQPSDIGSIGSARVIHASEKGGVVYHRATSPLEVGSHVSVSADKKLRLDHCRQHTGEHILSGVASDLFNAVNVGFHMAETYSTLDFDIPLSDEQLRTLEAAANMAVMENHRIHYDIVDAKGLKKLTLRKKTEGLEEKSDRFRIVYIDGVDSCTCCATHCNFTGEVGLIKLTSVQSHRGGVRVWFLCGERAYNHCREMCDISSAIARRFSTSESELVTTIDKMTSENSEMKRLLKSKTAELMNYRCKELTDSAATAKKAKIIVSKENGSASDIRVLADRVIHSCDVIAVLFSVAGDSLHYVVGVTDKVNAEVGDVCGTVNMLTNGKGGGRGELAQGKATYKSESELAQVMEQLLKYLVSAY